MRFGVTGKKQVGRRYCTGKGRERQIERKRQVRRRTSELRLPRSTLRPELGHKWRTPRRKGEAQSWSPASVGHLAQPLRTDRNAGNSEPTESREGGASEKSGEDSAGADVIKNRVEK
jgi:hypothetical protein